MQVCRTSKCYDRWGLRWEEDTDFVNNKCVCSWFIISWMTAKGHCTKVLYIKHKIFTCKIETLWVMPMRKTTRAKTALVGGIHLNEIVENKIYEQPSKWENVQTWYTIQIY